jgi:hypothetical protein
MSMQLADCCEMPNCMKLERGHRVRRYEVLSFIDLDLHDTRSIAACRDSALDHWAGASAGLRHVLPCLKAGVLGVHPVLMQLCGVNSVSNHPAGRPREQTWGRRQTRRGWDGWNRNHPEPPFPSRTTKDPPCCRTRTPQWEGVLILNTA